MPFFREISGEGFRGGIWKIAESWEELCGLLPREDYHRTHILQCFRLEKRRLEYAAVRALLFTLTGEDREVLYHPSGRPYFSASSCHLSISHTAGYVAVLLSQEGRAGVDIEACSSRVLRLKKHIAGAEEHEAEGMFALLLHWSAKETAFKILDEEGIDFTRHLTVRNFSCTADEQFPDAQGNFDLSYRLNEGRNGVFHISYLTTRDFVLTYSVERRTGA